MDVLELLPDTRGECEGCRREDAAAIKGCTRCGGTGNEPQWITVPVWACPECLSFYASSSAGDLAAIATHAVGGEETGSRADCSHCGAERVRVDVPVPVPTPTAERSAA